MRSIGADPALLDVEVSDDGAVRVEEEVIGALIGFRFTPDAAARGQDHKRLLAAAELRLPKELARRAQRRVEAPDTQFTLVTEPGSPVAVQWSGLTLGTLVGGKSLLDPRFRPEASIARLDPALRSQIEGRVAGWLSRLIASRLGAVQRIAGLAQKKETPAALRGILAQLAEQGGVLDRRDVDAGLSQLDRKERHHLTRLGVTLGTLDIFLPALLKPEATRLRLALAAVRNNQPMLPLPLPGLGLLDKPAPILAEAARAAGFRRFGDQMLRIDLVEKIARAAHEARGTARVATLDPALAISLGIGSATYARLMRALGFQPTGGETNHIWRWRGRPRRTERVQPTNAAFDILRQLKR